MWWYLFLNSILHKYFGGDTVRPINRLVDNRGNNGDGFKLKLRKIFANIRNNSDLASDSPTH